MAAVAQVVESTLEGETDQKIYAKFIFEGEEFIIYENDLLCPLTGKLLEEPTIASDGHTYSKSAITALVAKVKASEIVDVKEVHGVESAIVVLSPITGEPLALEDGFTVALRPNRAVQSILENPWLPGKKVPEISRDNFLCPIGYDLLLGPVVQQDGRTYSFHNIVALAESSPADVVVLPFDRQYLNLAYPNHLLSRFLKCFALAKGLYVGVENPIHREIIKCTLIGDIAGLRRLCTKDPKLATAVLNPKGYKVAHIAALAGQTIVFDLLVELGISLDCAAPQNITPMHAAAIMGQVSAIIYLARHGLNVRAKAIGGVFPLHLAAMKPGNHAATKVLVELAPDTIDEPMADGKTALLIGAIQDITSAFVLLGKKADYTKTDDAHNTVLHIISGNKVRFSGDLYQVIIEHCVSIQTIRNNKGLTPLHTGVINRNALFVEAWLKWARDKQIDTQDTGMGGTALVYSCINKLPHIAHGLLEAGANHSISTFAGATAIQFAQQQSEMGIVTELQSLGAQLPAPEMRFTSIRVPRVMGVPRFTSVVTPSDAVIAAKEAKEKEKHTP